MLAYHHMENYALLWHIDRASFKIEYAITMKQYLYGNSYVLHQWSTVLVWHVLFATTYRIHKASKKWKNIWRRNALDKKKKPLISVYSYNKWTLFTKRKYLHIYDFVLDTISKIKITAKGRYHSSGCFACFLMALLICLENVVFLWMPFDSSDSI